MEEIKVGEYCRTDTGNIYIMKYFIKEFDYSKIKHSFNIIDLIQVGDIVRIEFPPDEYCNEPVEVIWAIKGSAMLNNLKCGIKSKEVKLKSIVTKEQFTAVEYKLDN